MIRIQEKYNTYTLVNKCNQVGYFMNGCTAVYQGVVGRHGIRCRPVFFQNILISVWVGRMVNIPSYLGYFIHCQKLDIHNHLRLLVVFSPHVGELMFPPIAYKHCFFMLANSMRLHHSHCFKITQKSACYSELANQ